MFFPCYMDNYSTFLWVCQEFFRISASDEEFFTQELCFENEKYSMTKIALSKNYRFCDNPEMIKPDKNIRANADSCFAPIIADSDVAKVPAYWGVTQ